MTIPLRLLRSPGAFDPSGELLLGPSKPFALLARLNLARGSVGRDDVAALLWSDADSPSRARASLRSALWTVRDRLGDVVESENGALRLVDGAFDSDWERFRQAVRSGNLADALAVCGTAPLAELEIEGERRWNRWVESRRTTLLAELLPLGDAAVERLRAEGAPDRAELVLSGLLALQPLSLPRWLARLHLLLDLGRPTEARSALGEATRVLLGEAPDPEEAIEVRAAFEEIESRLSGTASPALGGTEEGLRLPLVGRGRELARLRSWTSDPSSPATAWVLGHAGIGKTRLVREFLDGLPTSPTGDPARVLWYACDRVDQSTRWSTLVGLAHALGQQSGAAGVSLRSSATLVNLAPSLSNTLGIQTLESPGSLEDVAIGDAVLDLIDAVGSDGPLVIVLDDVHWCDPASLDAIRRVSRGLHGSPVSIVGTARSGEVDRDVVSRLHSDGAGGQALHIELHPLGLSDTARAVRELLDVPDGSLVVDLVHRLHELSAGSPLGLTSILQEMESRELLRRTEGGRFVFVGDSAADITIPETLTELIRSRVDSLSPSAWTLLHRVARSRGPLPIQRVAAGRDGPARAVGALRELEERHLVTRDDRGQIVFPHAVTGEIVRRILPDDLPSTSPPWWRRPSAIAAVIAVLTVAGLAAVTAMVADPAPPAPYGGGRIVVHDDDRFLWATPLPGGGWDLSPIPDGPSPRGGRVRAAVNGTGVRWLVSPADSTRSPDLYEWIGPDSLRPVFVRPLDVSFLDVSPDGRWALVRTDDPSSPEYDSELYRVDIENPAAEPVRLGSFASGFIQMRWSPDGRRLAMIQRGADSLALYRPDMELLASIAVPAPGNLVWCSPTRLVLNTSGPDLPPTVHVVDLDEEAPRVWAVGDYPITVPGACSPDGEHLVAPFAIDGVRRHAVLELESGLLVDTLPASAGIVAATGWRGPRPLSSPVSLRTTEALAIDWGERVPLDVEVTMAAGRPADPPEVEWRSSDPLVASVGPGPTVIGNRPGAVWLEASVDGWLVDSTRVRVMETAPASLVFLQEFGRDGLDGWRPFGVPAATLEPSRWDDGLTLRVGGDGRWLDGTVTDSAFRFERGVRLELEFRMRLTRDDRQNVQVCLVSDEILSPEPAPAQTSIDARWTLCSTWPFGERVDFRPDLAFISVAASGATVRVPEDLQDGERWALLGLVVRPDGYAELWVDGEFRRVSVLREPDFTARRWHIGIFGKDVDTRLEVRSLAVWHGS